jgi:hypothetical protein
MQSEYVVLILSIWASCYVWDFVRPYDGTMSQQIPFLCSMPTSF